MESAGNRTAGKVAVAGQKPFNRLVPVPPPREFMMAAEEEEKKEGVAPSKRPVVGRAVDGKPVVGRNMMSKQVVGA